MRGFKEPGFQDRVAAASSAKNKALEQLRNKPPVDEAEQARRAANRLAKEAAAREKREAARRAKEAAERAKEEAEAAKREQARQEEEAALAAQPRVKTEAELKAARDARYAARKARK